MQDLAPAFGEFDQAAALNRHIDMFILADARIAFGNAATEEEWMRWHHNREHAGLMVASLELSDPTVTRYSDVLGRV
ncbi:hypothetical protein SEA_LIGMA_87 [Gordonia phage Ligma]|nr:hypothetical protein SEA_LIGMA_87 [Gordonia phage Ligma]UQT02186.1 hypothetical protein SEA_AXUMITE_87 [Gordonia phage Axumite]